MPSKNQGGQRQQGGGRDEHRQQQQQQGGRDMQRDQQQQRGDRRDQDRK